MSNKVININKKKKFKVLVIDDELELLEVVADQILMLGYDVLTASTVSEAMDKMPYCDGILSDVNMPERERLTQFLKTAQEKIPVIRFSAEQQTNLVNFMLSKPFKMNALKRTLENLEVFAGLNAA
jgi:CheY-like chemotaxis protein